MDDGEASLAHDGAPRRERVPAPRELSSGGRRAFIRPCARCLVQHHIRAHRPLKTGRRPAGFTAAIQRSKGAAAATSSSRSARSHIPPWIGARLAAVAASSQRRGEAQGEVTVLSTVAAGAAGAAGAEQQQQITRARAHTRVRMAGAWSPRYGPCAIIVPFGVPSSTLLSLPSTGFLKKIRFRRSTGLCLSFVLVFVVECTVCASRR